MQVKQYNRNRYPALTVPQGHLKANPLKRMFPVVPPGAFPAIIINTSHLQNTGTLNTKIPLSAKSYQLIAISYQLKANSHPLIANPLPTISADP
jgi:hypothetical protein